MRRWWVVAAAMAAVVAVPLVVYAAVGAGDGPLNHQEFADRTSSTSTTSTTFVSVPGLDNVLTCSTGPVAVTFSGALSGAHAGFEVRIDNGPAMLPGAAFFKPDAAGTNAFSFTWVANVSAFEGSDGHSLGLVWRSTGGSTTLLRADLDVQYDDPQTCQG